MGTRRELALCLTAPSAWPLRPDVACATGSVPLSLLLQVPKLPLPPPYQSNWTLQDGVAVDKDMYDTMVDMISKMNAAIDTLPDLSPA